MKALRWFCVLLVAVGPGWNATADETSVLYSNLSTETRFFLNASFEVVWDDLDLAKGGLLTGMTLVVNNSRPVPEPGSLVEVEFREYDYVSDGPLGSLIGSVKIDLRGESIPPGDSIISVDDLAAFGVVLPRERIAVGVIFDDPTRSFGLITFDPPTVGASSPSAWLGEDARPVTCFLGGEKSVPCNFGLELRSSAILVSIDLKPGDARNTINPAQNGVLWVAILAEAQTPFDPLQILIPSVRFGAGEARADHFRVHDVNRDGLVDLLLRFRTSEVGVDCGDNEVALTAETYTGRLVWGKDRVNTVGCRPR
jgi:hypothetical protein